MSIDPRCYLLAALLVLTVPLPWLAAAITAAAVHELFHIIMVRLCGTDILGVSIGPGGAVIRTAALTQGQEILCALAGPTGSLILLFLCHRMPRLALCGAVQGAFNLLPFYPLDGGRAVRGCLQLLFPGIGRQLADGLEAICFAFLLLLAFRYHSPMLLFLWGYLMYKVMERKKPCKESIFRVQ